MSPRIVMRLFSMAAIVAVILTRVAHGATLYWDANGTTAGRTDGAGAWLTANQWWDGATNTTWTTGDSAVFGHGGAGGAVSLASPTSIGTLTFNYFTGTYTLGTISQTLTINNGITMNAGGGAVTFLSPITLGAAQTWTNNSANTLTVNDGTNSVINTNGFTLTFKGDGPNQGKFNIARGNGITGSGGIVVDNAYLDLRTGGAQSTNNYTGTTTVQNGGGILKYSQNIGGGNIILNGGYIDGYFNEGFTRALGTGNNQIQIIGGVSGFGTNGSATINLGGAGAQVTWGSATFNPSALMLGTATSSAGTTTFANAIDLNGANRTVIANSSTNAGAISGVISNGTGTAGLTKTGVGELQLTAANIYNGATSINRGTLTLSGSGTSNSSSALNLADGGILRLLNTAQVNRFTDSASISVTTGGGITYENASGANVYTETLGSATVSGGQFNINLATNQASTGSQTLTLGGLSQSGSGSVTFSAATTGPQASGNKNMIVVTGAGTTTAGEIVGPWATIGTAVNAQTDYAVYNGNYVTAAGIASSAQSAWSTIHALGSNYTLTNASGTAADGRLSATRNINSLRNTTAVGGAITVNTATDYITLAGNAFADGDVIVFGTSAGGITAGAAYYVRDYNGDAAGGFKIAATSGGAAIDITATNTGTVTAGLSLGTNTLGTYGILNGSATSMVIGAAAGGRITLPTTVAGNLYINTGSGGIISHAPITDNTGALTLVKNGSGTLTLFGVNTYTGDTIINAGALQLGFQANPNPPVTNPSLGSGTYAGNIFIAAGASLNIYTTANQTLSGIISGAGNLNKQNTGTLTLGDSNTYTGKTTLTFSAPANAGGGTTIVSSFNSVNGGTPLRASSSLGAPTTVANGTIDFGSGGTQASITLQYSGVLATGETTDRIINFNFNSNGTRTINASGSGLLKFTSAPTSNGTATGGITLGGSGSGEFSQGIPFNFLSLSKTGASSWTLGGPIGTGGGVTLDGANAGSRLNINHRQALGTGTFTISGGNNASFDNTSGAAITLSTNNAQTWSNDFTFIGTNDLNMGTGAVSMGGNRAVTVSGGMLTVGGVISGAGFGITLGGGGTMVLTGANTFTGPVIIGNNATSTLRLSVNTIANVGGGSSALGAPTTAGNGLIQIGQTSNHSTLEFINLATDQSTDRQIQIGSSSGGSGGAYILNNDADNTVTFSNAAFNVAATGTSTFTRYLRLGGSNAGNNTISGAIISNGATSGTTGLIKQDAGKWILAGVNTYSGTTSVNGGTLVVNGSLTATTSVTVATGATLQGSGTINSSVAINAGGTLAAGNSIESLATGDLTLAAAAILAYEMNNDAAASAAGDLTAVAGNLSIANAATILTLSELGAGSWTAGEKLTLIAYSGTWNNGLFSYNSSTLADDSTITFSGTQWTFNYNDTAAGTNYTGDLTGMTRYVTMTAIPEPGVAMLGGLSLLGLLLRRRR